MRTFIHIGQHKTGTTSIQHYLKENRTDLGQRGLYIADSLAGESSPSHFMLNMFALNEHRYSSMKEKFLAAHSVDFFSRLKYSLPLEIATHYKKAEDSGCTDIVWSNEGLYLLNSMEEYARLKGLFEKHSTEIVCICCFREVESYKNSYRQQLKKQGISHSDIEDSYRNMSDDSWLFNYRRKKRLLRKAFGKIIIFQYEKNGMVEKFMECIDHPINTKNIPRLNVTKNS